MHYFSASYIVAHLFLTYIYWKRLLLQALNNALSQMNGIYQRCRIMLLLNYINEISLLKLCGCRMVFLYTLAIIFGHFGDWNVTVPSHCNFGTAMVPRHSTMNFRFWGYLKSKIDTLISRQVSELKNSIKHGVMQNVSSLIITTHSCYSLFLNAEFPNMCFKVQRKKKTNIIQLSVSNELKKRLVKNTHVNIDVKFFRT